MKNVKVYSGCISKHFLQTEVAGAFRTDFKLPDGVRATLLITEEDSDSINDSTEPQETKTVWQWRYKAPGQRHWKIARSLLTESEVEEYYGYDCKVEKLTGPFEVPL